MTQSEIDELMMRRCIELARQAEGRTSPNPMVGAVVLDSFGEKVGEGFHPKAGQSHAEVFAFNQAQERARGGTLYVNLEPCSHFGRTPPCANRVLESGVKRVVIGMKDPNPRVCGNGIKLMQEAGISVEYSTLENECKDLNRAFVKRIEQNLPWVTLKMACTLDGRIADREGRSRWVSGPEARTFVHSMRNLYDCVLIGGATALADNPELNVRGIANSRNPHRAVVDPGLKVTPQARLCQHDSAQSAWTVIFTSSAKVTEAERYPQSVRLLPCDDGNGKIDLLAALKWLSQNEVQTVLCEGGGRLAAALLENGLVDEVLWILAPKLLTDEKALAVLAGSKETKITEAVNLQQVEYSSLGKDLLVRARLKTPTNNDAENSV